jgi:small conductance mechanosensitive channel
MRGLIVMGVFAVLLLALAGDEAPVFSQEQADSTRESTPSERMEAGELMVTMESALDSILVIESRMRGKDEDTKQVLRVQGRKYVESIGESQPKLLKLISSMEEKEIEAGDIRERFRKFLIGEAEIYERSFEFWSHEIDRLRDRRASATPEEMGDFEEEITATRERLDRILTGQTVTLTIADSLGMDTDPAWEQIENVLKNRAENLVGRMQIAVNQRERLETAIRDAAKAGAPEAELGANRIRLQSLNRRIEGVARSLDETVGLLEERGYDGAPYRQSIIMATRKITKRVLDPRVLFGIVRDFLGRLWKSIKENALVVVIKLLIIAAFVVLFRILFRLTWWALRLSGMGKKMSRLMTDLVGRLLKSIATIVGLIVGLSFLGVDPTTLLAGVGVAGVIVGLALQDSLSNLAAGFFILSTRPYDVDDVVTAGGVVGTVKAMGLANTSVVTFDNRRMLVPNRKIWGEVIENRSAEYYRRVELEIRVAYDEDIDRAFDILRDLLAKNDRIMETPEPHIFVSKWADSWIEIAVRPWTRNADWWPMLTELPRLIRLRFAEEGIEIPIPQTEITMQNRPERPDGDPDTRGPAVE